MKFLNVTHIDSEKIQLEFRAEIQTLKFGCSITYYLLGCRSLDHYNIVSCFGCFIDDRDSFLITEYMPLCLFKWISQQTQEIEYSLICKIIFGIANGMNHLHTRKPMIIHRDLKSPNILVKNESFVFYLHK